MILTSVLATNAKGSDTRVVGLARSMCGSGCWAPGSWKEYDLLQAEAWRDGHDHPNDRFQRGDRGVQELEFHRVGRCRPGQDPPSVAPLPPPYQQSVLRKSTVTIESGSRMQKEELNKMMSADEMLDATVPVFADTQSTATRQEKYLTDVRKK